MRQKLAAAAATAIAALGLLASCDQGYEKSPYLEGSPPRYDNPYYGVNVAIPSGLDVCVLGDGLTISHGFVIPLTRDPHCKLPHPYARPHINVFFDFGALYDEIPTVNDLAAHECQERLKRIDMPALRISGYDTAVCRGPYVNKDNDAAGLGRDLFETALFVWAGDTIAFKVGLVTTEDRLPHDLETLDRVLQGIVSLGTGYVIDRH